MGAQIISFGPEDFAATHNLQMKIQVSQHNRELKSAYANQMASYNLFIDQVGKLPSWPVPQVPNGWALSDPDPDSGLQFQIDGGAVCDPLPVHQVVTETTKDPSKPHIGKRLKGSNFWQALADDAFPGDAVTDPGTIAGDGTVGTFQKIASPIGFSENNVAAGAPVRGVYLKIA